MILPEPLQAALRAVRTAGGRPHLVGGCVRDWLLGLVPKDFDVEVYGMGFEELSRALAPFGPTDLVGRSFGVLKIHLGGSEYDFGLPRRESKTGAGHRGFAVAPDPSLDEAAAAARRDFTINAIAYDPFAGRLIDPHGGIDDLRRKILRHTSAAFVEDPLRVLRGFQLAARFDLALTQETAALCSSIAESFPELPHERVWGEWDKWATKCVVPSRGIIVLEATGWLAHFPEIAAMRGVPQEPEWHPEGDVLTHTLHCLDALVTQPAWAAADALRRRVWMFATLAHDFGKATTTHQAEHRGRQRWISPGHEAAGGPLTETFLHRIGAPHGLIDHVRPLVMLHLTHEHGRTNFTDNSVRRLARKLCPATLDDLIAVMLADHYGRPPLIAEKTMARIEELRQAAQRLVLARAAPRPILLGRHLLAAGLTSGPAFRPIIDAAFEAQLDGAFHDEAGAQAWLQKHLHQPPAARPS
ncbi:MAG: polynucleotide adenylyltransferase [Opitutaceae bacterium]|nr:polynucleotide adenylyltransferase [Opitutaceae bacterium]